jgi:hypothetical protein
MQPSIDVGELFRALVLFVNVECPVAEELGQRLPQRTLTFALRFLFKDVLVLPWGFGRRLVACIYEVFFVPLLPVLGAVDTW